jgi:hypothetical protein
MFKKEITGYNFIKERMRSEEGKTLLRTKLAIFSVFYIGTVLELLLRLQM